MKKLQLTKIIKEEISRLQEETLTSKYIALKDGWVLNIDDGHDIGRFPEGDPYAFYTAVHDTPDAETLTPHRIIEKGTIYTYIEDYKKWEPSDVAYKSMNEKEMKDLVKYGFVKAIN